MRRSGNDVTIDGYVEQDVTFVVSTVGGENEITKEVSVTLVPETLKTIAYITDPEGANYAKDRDHVLKALKEDGRFYVREFSSATVGNDYSLFDMVVISETTPSTAPIMAELEGLEKPMLLQQHQCLL